MEKKLLRILKDRTFLLDLLMQHETTAPEFESTDEDVTDSSDQEEVKPSRAKIAEKKHVTFSCHPPNSASFMLNDIILFICSLYLSEKFFGIL